MSSPSPPSVDAEDEMDRLMRSSPPPEFEEDGQTTHEGHTGGNGNSAAQIAPAGSINAESDASFHQPGIPRNEVMAMRNLVKRLKLHPYQRQAVEDFVKCGPVYRDGQLLVAILALENKTDTLIASAPPFSINGPLHQNIKSFIIAVLLSSKLAAYKGTIPRDHVLALVMRDRLHLPNTFDRDPTAAKLLKEEVNHELAQARGKLKKAIKAGIGKNIFDLATSLVNGTSCTLTVPLCGRVALFRKVYRIDPGDDFWDSVDTELQKIQKKASNNPGRISRYFAAILKHDQQTYLGEDPSSTYSIPNTVLPSDQWQLSVENMIAGDTTT